LIGPWRRRKDTPANQQGEAFRDNDMKIMDGKVDLNPEVWFLFTAGQDRLRLYFEAFYIQGDMSDPSLTEDAEDGVPLKMIEHHATKQSEKRDIDIKGITSLDSSFLTDKVSSRMIS
jgi:hypothetical protein